MIYDCFMFNGEHDMLELHLNLLNDHVDRFVICESKQTFSGKEKPLYFLESVDRYAKWKEKIIYHIVPPADFATAFERAGFQKDSIRQALKDCKPDDIIIYGDVDEVINPAVLDKEGKCRQLAYSYYLNNRSSEDWQGTNICKYKNLYDLNAWRANHDVIIENGGWHFTNCMNHSELLRKLDSYDHQEANIPWVREGLKARMDANVDFLGRVKDWKGNDFKLWVDESELPKYILDNKEKYKHLWK